MKSIGATPKRQGSSKAMTKQRRMISRHTLGALAASAYRHGARFVDEGDIITSAGVTAGIDMALYLAGDQAEMVAREIEWTQGAVQI